eukprot:Rhum_TRINITY_DN1447_c0_g1::Rhum_TRINITY_DN1447_c0_g1_i1::g.4232::m.4232/K14808/DDX54, DBP10; ATP-dependent RNA helicase DDX54/DBP10
MSAADDEIRTLAAALKGAGIEQDMEAAAAFPSAKGAAEAFPDAAGAAAAAGDESSSDDGMNEEGKKGKKKKRTGGFQSFGLAKEIMRGVQAKGYIVPTPIQRKAVPVLMEGNDVVAMARTGSGKTAAYLIPLLNQLRAHSPTVGARGLILSPTRELAIQILKVAKQLSRFTDLRYCVIVGGLALSEQFTDLAGNPDVLIGSPGRLLHIIMETDMKLKRVEYVVLDEADRLFETGSLGTQVVELIKRLPDTRQVSLFSATLPAGLAEFASAGLNEPKVIRLDTETKISDKLTLSYFMVRREEKLPALLFVLRDLIKLPESKSSTIVFVPTKHHGELIAQVFSYFGMGHSFIHGSMDQEAKTIELQNFHDRKVYILVVTDVAARGIDVPLLDNVINYEFPDRPKLFVHRVGRAARAGRAGKAYSLITRDELPHIIDLHHFLGHTLKNTAADLIDDKDDEEPEEGEEKKERELPVIENPEDGFFGRLPEYLLDDDTMSLQLVLNEHPEVQNQLKTSQNAYKLYSKTRKGAASESIKKTKAIFEAGIELHPIFLQEEFNTRAVVARADVLKTISNFRPAANIFEAQKLGTKGLFQTTTNQGSGPAAFEAPVTLMSLAAQKKPKRKLTKKEELRANLLARVGTQSRHVAPVSKLAKNDEDEERDEFYIPYAKGGRAEEAGYSVNELKDAVLDVNADSSEGMVRQRQVFVWKAKANKYVKMNMGDAKAVNTKTKNESGKRIEFAKGEQGKLLEKWSKQTKIRIQAAGEEEDTTLYDPNRRKRKATAMAEDEVFGTPEGADETGAPAAKRQKLGHKGKKKQAIRSAEVKTFDTLRKEKKVAATKAAKKGGGKGGKGGKGGGKGGKGKKK